MIGVVAANVVVTRYYARSIFHRQIRRWGIDLDRPQEQRLMTGRQVKEIMSPQFLAVRPGRTAAELQAFVERGHVGDVFVADAGSMRLVGVVTESNFISAYRQAVKEIREEQGRQ